ncbi:MAG: hypothetical protein KGL31_13735 [candidate division NC10 bacterium]|nr:hypothetical protein [candidate division NC10 bacterium]MDE2322951.1 hypothetical protein [candidate division NC10 bacterium]
MTKVAILPIPPEHDGLSCCAIADTKHAEHGWRSGPAIGVSIATRRKPSSTYR